MPFLGVTRADGDKTFVALSKSVARQAGSGRASLLAFPTSPGWPTSDAERRKHHSHAERGNEGVSFRRRSLSALGRFQGIRFEFAGHTRRDKPMHPIDAIINTARRLTHLPR
jgi:hypothetical protein